MASGRSAPVDCEIVGVDDLIEWDHARRESEQADFFNSPLLLRCLHHHFFPIAAVVAKRNGRVIGGCFGWDRSIGRKRILQHPPTLGQGTLWVRDAGLNPSVQESMARDVSAALMEFLPKHFDRIHLCAGPELPATMWFASGGWDVQANHTYRFPLSTTEESWNRITSPRRREVRSTRDSGYTAETSDGWQTLAQGFQAMMKRRGMPCPPVDVFMRTLVEEVHREKLGQLFVAKDRDGQPVMAILIVWHGDRASLYIGAAADPQSQAGVTTLLYWKAIEWLCERGGHRILDLYGLGLEGIGVYKKTFNANIAVGADIMFVTDPSMRLRTHLSGAWGALKRKLTGKRYGSELDLRKFQ